MHEVAGNVWYVARERDERLSATWAGALCSLASGSENRLSQARAELRQAEAICKELSDEELLEQNARFLPRPQRRRRKNGLGQRLAREVPPNDQRRNNMEAGLDRRSGLARSA